MVVLGIIKVLSETGVPVIVIFGTFHVEVVDPAKLTVYVTIFNNLRVFWHSGSFYFVLIIGVHCLLLSEILDFLPLSLATVLVKVLPIKAVI